MKIIIILLIICFSLFSCRQSGNPQKKASSQENPTTQRQTPTEMSDEEFIKAITGTWCAQFFNVQELIMIGTTEGKIIKKNACDLNRDLLQLNLSEVVKENGTFAVKNSSIRFLLPPNEREKEGTVLIGKLTKENIDFRFDKGKKSQFVGTFSHNRQELKGHFMKQQ